MAKAPIRAMVTAPTFINGVLHLPGEIAHVDLDALGVDKLGEGTHKITDADGKERTITANLTPGLRELTKDDAEGVVQVPVAAVSPHAPDAPNPQGIPPGTVQSGTGRLIHPSASPDVSETTEYVGADKPGIEGEQTPVKPAKGK